MWIQNYMLSQPITKPEVDASLCQNNSILETFVNAGIF